MCDVKEMLARSFESFIKDRKLIDAFLKVPREDFIPKSLAGQAYDDNPLSIGHGQTISQPTTVMLMAQWLELEETDTVLEVGAGCGYNAAIMSLNAKRIISVEIIKELAEMAKKNTKSYKNIKIIHGDATDRNIIAKYTPYDKIILTAACSKIPDIFMKLAKGGIILAPVGKWYQKMVRFRHGKRENLGPFRFVPLKDSNGRNI